MNKILIRVNKKSPKSKLNKKIWKNKLIHSRKKYWKNREIRKYDNVKKNFITMSLKNIRIKLCLKNKIKLNSLKKINFNN